MTLAVHKFLKWSCNARVTLKSRKWICFRQERDYESDRVLVTGFMGVLLWRDIEACSHMLIGDLTSLHELDVT